MNTTPTRAFGATSAHAPLAPLTIQRREPGPTDVDIEILYSGICHSDLHSVRDEWNAFMPTVYPIVPGHEIVGRVTRVGARVTKFKKGDIAAAAVSWIRTARAASAAKASSSSARTWCSRSTRRTRISAA